MNSTETLPYSGEADAIAERPHGHRPAPPRHEDDVIDVSHLVRIWLRWIWLPVLLALASAYFGYKSLQAFTPQAQAAMIVLPTGTSGPATPSVSLGGLAAQLGVQIAAPAAAVSPFDRLKLVLSSLDLAARLQEKYGLMQRIYSGWDPEAGTWPRPSSEEFEKDQRRRAFFRQNLWSPPNLESLGNFVGGAVKVEAIATSGFQRVTVTHPDPEFALWLLSTAFVEADNLLREKDRIQSAERRAYVERELQKQSVFQVQEALRSQLNAEVSRALALESNLSPYTATIIESPHILNRRTEPNLTLMFATPMITGGAIGFALITLLALIRRERA